MIIYIVGERKKLEERGVRQDKMIGVQQAAFGMERTQRNRSKSQGRERA
jgi:hypothetical protein